MVLHMCWGCVGMVGWVAVGRPAGAGGGWQGGEQQVCVCVCALEGIFRSGWVGGSGAPRGSALTFDCGEVRLLKVIAAAQNLVHYCKHACLPLPFQSKLCAALAADGRAPWQSRHAPWQTLAVSPRHPI